MELSRWANQQNNKVQKNVFHKFWNHVAAIALVVNQLMTPLATQAQTPGLTPKGQKMSWQAIIDSLSSETFHDKICFFLEAVAPLDKSLAQIQNVIKKSATIPHSVEIKFATLEKFDEIMGKHITQSLHRAWASCILKKEERKDGTNTRDLLLIGIDPDKILNIPDLGGTLINEYTTVLDSPYASRG